MFDCRTKILQNYINNCGEDLEIPGTRGTPKRAAFKEEAANHL